MIQCFTFQNISCCSCHEGSSDSLNEYFKQKETIARLFVDFHLTPWCSQEGDDLVFEVVDYDKGAQQGDLMCTCVVPNKATARGDCTNEDWEKTAPHCMAIRYTTGTLLIRRNIRQ